MQLKIEVIDRNSQHLDAVIALGRTYSSKLGHMPDGGFIDHAGRRHIIVALTPDEQCVGYLMYRITGQNAYIVHLCVDKNYRNRGIAKSLVNYLIQETKTLYSIYLNCRRDYNLEKMWQSLGFVPKYEKPGRSFSGKLLTVWSLSQQQPEFLSILTQEKFESKLCVAIDANIFFDLDTDDNIDRESRESKALLADWLQPELELCLTDEIYNEINRNANDKARERLRNLVSKFTSLHCDHEDFEEACQSLKSFFPETMTPNQRSDFHQIARAVASNVQFFITRDQELLKLDSQVYSATNLSVVSPTDLIIQLDELRREAKYQPVRLEGTSVYKALVKNGEQDLIISSLLLYSKGETKSELKRILNHYLTEKNKFECIALWQRETPIALIVYDRQNLHELNIPFFRVKHNALAPTLIRYLLFLFTSSSA